MLVDFVLVDTVVIDRVLFLLPLLGAASATAAAKCQGATIPDS